MVSGSDDVPWRRNCNAIPRYNVFLQNGTMETIESTSSRKGNISTINMIQDNQKQQHSNKEPEHPLEEWNAFYSTTLSSPLKQNVAHKDDRFDEANGSINVDTNHKGESFDPDDQYDTTQLNHDYFYASYNTYRDKRLNNNSNNMKKNAVTIDHNFKHTNHDVFMSRLNRQLLERMNNGGIIQQPSFSSMSQLSSSQRSMNSTTLSQQMPMEYDPSQAQILSVPPMMQTTTQIRYPQNVNKLTSAANDQTNLSFDTYSPSGLNSLWVSNHPITLKNQKYETFATSAFSRSMHNDDMKQDGTKLLLGDAVEERQDAHYYRPQNHYSMYEVSDENSFSRRLRMLRMKSNDYSDSVSCVILSPSVNETVEEESVSSSASLSNWVTDTKTEKKVVPEGSKSAFTVPDNRNNDDMAFSFVMKEADGFDTTNSSHFAINSNAIIHRTTIEDFQRSCKQREQKQLKELFVKEADGFDNPNSSYFAINSSEIKNRTNVEDFQGRYKQREQKQLKEMFMKEADGFGTPNSSHFAINSNVIVHRTNVEDFQRRCKQRELKQLKEQQQQQQQLLLQDWQEKKLLQQKQRLQQRLEETQPVPSFSLLTNTASASQASSTEVASSNTKLSKTSSYTSMSKIQTLLAHAKRNVTKSVSSFEHKREAQKQVKQSRTIQQLQSQEYDDPSMNLSCQAWAQLLSLPSAIPPAIKTRASYSSRNKPTNYNNTDRLWERWKTTSTVATANLQSDIFCADTVLSGESCVDGSMLVPEYVYRHLPSRASFCSFTSSVSSSCSSSGSSFDDDDDDDDDWTSEESSYSSATPSMKGRLHRTTSARKGKYEQDDDAFFEWLPTTKKRKGMTSNHNTSLETHNKYNETAGSCKTEGLEEDKYLDSIEIVADINELSKIQQLIMIPNNDNLGPRNLSKNNEVHFISHATAEVTRMFRKDNRSSKQRQQDERYYKESHQSVNNISQDTVMDLHHKSDPTSIEQSNDVDNNNRSKTTKMMKKQNSNKLFKSILCTMNRPSDNDHDYNFHPVVLHPVDGDQYYTLDTNTNRSKIGRSAGVGTESFVPIVTDYHQHKIMIFTSKNSQKNGDDFAVPDNDQNNNQKNNSMINHNKNDVDGNNAIATTTPTTTTTTKYAGFTVDESNKNHDEHNHGSELSTTPNIVTPPRQSDRWIHQEQQLGSKKIINASATAAMERFSKQVVPQSISSKVLDDKITTIIPPPTPPRYAKKLEWSAAFMKEEPGTEKVATNHDTINTTTTIATATNDSHNPQKNALFASSIATSPLVGEEYLTGSTLSAEAATPTRTPRKKGFFWNTPSPPPLPTSSSQVISDLNLSSQLIPLIEQDNERGTILTTRNGTIGTKTVGRLFCRSRREFGSDDEDVDGDRKDVHWRIDPVYTSHFNGNNSNNNNYKTHGKEEYQSIATGATHSTASTNSTKNPQSNSNELVLKMKRLAIPDKNVTENN